MQEMAAGDGGGETQAALDQFWPKVGENILYEFLMNFIDCRQQKRLGQCLFLILKDRSYL